MSAIQIFCSGGRTPCSGVINSWPIKGGAFLEFASLLLALRFLAIALMLFVRQKKARGHNPCSALRSYFDFLGGSELRVFS